MKIKRVFAKDMRQGIRLVREELGEDAVILSNNKVEGGIEIVVGIDYDESILDRPPVPAADSSNPSSKENQLDIFDKSAEPEEFSQAIQSATSELESLLDSGTDGSSMTYARPAKRRKPAASRTSTPEVVIGRENDASGDNDELIGDMRDELKSLRSLLEDQVSGLAWGEMSRNHPHQATLLKRFMDMGLEPQLAQQLVSDVSDDDELEQAWRDCLNRLAGKFIVPPEDFIAEGGIVALVGPTGVGKTTTVAKLAARYALQHGYQQVALVTTDSYRIGAHEQLKTYGRILGIPVRVANDAEELSRVLESLSDKRLVLIDTAGMSQRDLRLTEQFNKVLSGAPKLKTCVVLSANTQTAGLNDVVRAFGKVKLDGCVLTKIDEAVSLGGVLSVIAESGLPVVYYSDGQKVPEDLHRAHPHNLINRAVEAMQERNEWLDEQSVALHMGGNNSHAS